MINSKLILPKIEVDRTEGPIVTSDLVLHLDAKDPSSYSGSGNSWLDLSGRNKHGTINGATFDGSNAFQFDGVNDFVSVGSLDVGMSQYAIHIWYKMDAFTTGFPNIIDVNSNTYHFNSGPRFSLRPNGDLTCIVSGHQSDSAVFDYINIKKGTSFDVWHNAVFMLNSSGQYSSYFNGHPVTLNSANVSGILGVFNDIDLGRGFSGSRYFKGKISKLLIYNVSHSSEQVLDNYNAIKPRFL